MRVLILCGGRGWIDPESRRRIPKGMAMIGGRPLLWHVMKIFAAQGHSEFVLALGEGGGDIREYFLQYRTHSQDVEISLHDGSIRPLQQLPEEEWRVKLVETGTAANTGSRIARCREYLRDEPFFLAYNDCLGNVSLPSLLAMHTAEQKIITVTGVQPPSRFGTFAVSDGQVTGYSLSTRLTGQGGYINGGFMVANPALFTYVEPFNECSLEREVFERLVEENQVTVFPHDGYWQAVDTERDVLQLNEIYARNERPWLP
jgi:glucose-1-phosphate cytidylyltransferase